MRILVACEESQAVTRELRKRGHEAYSCDRDLFSGANPEWHIMVDVTPLLNGRCKFKTLNGDIHSVSEKWDAIIAFPPCTDLAVSGAAWFEKKRKSGDQLRSLEFFSKFLKADCDRIAIENPVGVVGGEYINKWFPEFSWMPKCTQIVQPYYFGDSATKKTCLWLKGLPELNHNPAEHVSGSVYHKSPSGKAYPDWCWKTGGGCGVKRSKTFPGIAKAMAEQWF